MGKTHTKKMEARGARLEQLPRSERLMKSAIIKKKEGRVLDAAEKHALMMTTEYGEALKLWEVLRTVDEQGNLGLSEAQEKRAKKAAKRAQVKVSKKTGAVATKFADSDNDDDDDASVDGDEAPESKVKKARDGAPKNAHKYGTVDRLFAIIEPKFESFARTPRISRVLQSMVKYGSNEHLDRIAASMMKDMALYCNDAFAHYILIALMRNATHALFRRLVAALIGVMSDVVTHAFGLKVVHAAYTSKLCSAGDRHLMALSVFKDNIAVMKTWRGYPVLEDILDQETTHRKRLLGHLFALVDKLVSAKEAHALPFIQRLVVAFIRFGTREEVTELCETLRPHLSTVVDASVEGSLLTNYVFSLLEPKAKKEPLRKLSERFVEVATGKYSAPVVARLFDLVYDAQLLHKYVAGPLAENMAAVVASPYGYLILVHILTPSKARKDRLLLPTWVDYNLYYAGSTTWNAHTWLDAEYKPETVEICPKPAQATHAAVLGPILEAFAAFVAAAGEGTSSHHIGVIAREAVNLYESEPSYRAAFANVNIDAIRERMPKKEKRPRDESDEGAAVLSVRRVEVSAPVASSPATSAAAKTKAAPAGKKAAPLQQKKAVTAKKSDAAADDAPVEVSARRSQAADDEAPAAPRKAKASGKKTSGDLSAAKKMALRRNV